MGQAACAGAGKPILIVDDILTHRSDGPTPTAVALQAQELSRWNWNQE